MTDSPVARRKLYGRRKGPKLSAHQQRLLDEMLPLLSLDLKTGADPRSYFLPPPCGEVAPPENRASQNVDARATRFAGGAGGGALEGIWLEVGFGGGEHLAWQAQHHPNVGIIGAEPFVNGVAKLLSKLDSLSATGGEGKGEGESADGMPPHPGPLPRWGRGRIGIYMGDAHDIVEALPDASLGRVFILFPDPWPKTRHHKRRFIQTQMLDELARAMKPGAELRFASDDAGYVEWTLERVQAHPAFEWTAIRAADWKTRPPDWPPTRYEAKALYGPPVYLRFVRSAI